MLTEDLDADSFLVDEYNLSRRLEDAILAVRETKLHLEDCLAMDHVLDGPLLPL